MPDFVVSPKNCKALLLGQGLVVPAGTSDAELYATGVEAGARVVDVLIDRGYRIQFHEGPREDVQVFKAGAEQAWVDPQIMAALAHDLGVDAGAFSEVLVEVLGEACAHLAIHPERGDFGVLRADGLQIMLDVAHDVPLVRGVSGP